MALFYPDFETIKKYKVPPTDGEMTLLRFLKENLDDSYEVYFNPYLNGDRPDVLIMRKAYGVMVIEVKDWNLDNFTLNEKKRWIYKPNGAVVKSPVDQVLKYKNNLYDLHVEDLLLHKIIDFRYFNIVTCAIYFHCASQEEIDNLLVRPYKEEKKYQTFLKYNIDFIGHDTLNKSCFVDILKKRYLIAKEPSLLFTNNLYCNFKRLLSPTLHLKASGIPYDYKPKQLEIIYSKTLEQRVRGVFGSGKTTVLAARAVQAYKRALDRKNNPRILILTFNITLKNFIHDKLNRVDDVFPEENFIIINYHQFINAELNNLNIDIVVPDDIPEDEVGDYLENNYYSNISLFENHKSHIVKYDAVLIDEIQDYHRKWMEIIKGYFRDPLGDYVLFGDVKQNIYGQPTSNKDVVTNVKGVNTLKYCFRSDFKIIDVAKTFQSSVFGDKYDIDDFSENGTFEFMGQRQEKEGYVNYMYLKGENTVASLYNIIRGNILNKTNDVAPNDITILGYTVKLIRTFDAYYRYASREKTNSMLETIESMYMSHLNYIGKDGSSNPYSGWFDELSSTMAKKMMPNRTKLYANDIVKLRQQMAILFTIEDLYKQYAETFRNRLSEQCDKCGMTIDLLMAFEQKYKVQLESFRDEVYYDDYKYIRNNKKLHFWMNSGTIKVSTINSFKGWESKVVFLILEPKYATTTQFNLSFDELLYTGLTRCMSSLVVLNYGNEEYDKKIGALLKEFR